MAKVQRLPAEQRLDALQSTLYDIDSDLPARVQRAFRAIVQRKRGFVSSDNALLEALTIALADTGITQAQIVGLVAMKRGRRAATEFAQRLVSGGAMSGLGASAGKTALRITGAIAQGVACSQGAATLATDIVGRSQGRTAADATAIGTEVLRGVARCPGSRAPLPQESAPPPPEVPRRGFPWLPVVIGVGALGAVGVAMWAMKRKSTTPNRRGRYRRRSR
jgi:hypothetical protein